MRPIPVRDPAEFDAMASAALLATGWYARLGATPHWPMSAEQAAELLAVGGEYDVDAAQLADLADRSIVSAPADGLWRPGDVIQAGAVLEARRQWVATPSYHDQKKHPDRLALEQDRTSDSVGDRVARHGLRLDVRHLVVLLVEGEPREVREKVAVELLAELELTHGVRL